MAQTKEKEITQLVCLLTKKYPKDYDGVSAISMTRRTVSILKPVIEIFF